MEYWLLRMSEFKTPQVKGRIRKPFKKVMCIHGYGMAGMMTQLSMGRYLTVTEKTVFHLVLEKQEIV